MAQRRVGFKFLFCVLFVNFINSATAYRSNSRLYNKAPEKSRPVVLVLDSPTVDNGQDNYRTASREVDYQSKSFPFEFLQKLLEGHSHDPLSRHKGPHHHHDSNRPRTSDKKYRSKNRYNNNYDRDLDDRRDRYRDDPYYNQDDRQSDLDYRNDRNRNNRNRDKDRRDRYSYDDERRDRYRGRGSEDRQRSRYYRERTRLRTENQGQEKQGDRQDQDRKDQDQDKRDQERRDQDRGDLNQDRKDPDQDRRGQDKDRRVRQRSDDPSAQIPIVKSLLRSLRCSARDDCEDSCNDYNGPQQNQCEDQCAQKFECDEESEEQDTCGQPSCTGSTRGFTIITERPKCKRCK